MNFLASILIVVAFFGSSFGQQDPIGCYVPGLCENGTITGVSVVEFMSDCHDFCRDATTCEYFSYSPADGTCVTYSDCPYVSTESCQDCYSAEATCSRDPCDIPGRIRVLIFIEI